MGKIVGDNIDWTHFILDWAEFPIGRHFDAKIEKKRSSVPIMLNLDSILENMNFDKDQNSLFTKMEIVLESEETLISRLKIRQREKSRIKRKERRNRNEVVIFLNFSRILIKSNLVWPFDDLGYLNRVNPIMIISIIRIRMRLLISARARFGIWGGTFFSNILQFEPLMVNFLFPLKLSTVLHKAYFIFWEWILELILELASLTATSN